MDSKDRNPFTMPGWAERNCRWEQRTKRKRQHRSRGHSWRVGKEQPGVVKQVPVVLLVVRLGVLDGPSEGK